MIGKRAPKAVKDALSKLDTGSDAYDSAYDSAMNRINGQVPDQAELAKQALALLTCAKRRLSSKELRAALGIETGEPEYDPDNCPDVEDILASCLGLVTIDEDSNTIRLVHYTTQKYLERTLDRWFPDAQPMITDICISYLSLVRYSDPDLRIHVEDSDWYDYSACHWYRHARLAPSRLPRVVNFLKHQPNVIRSEIACRGLRDQDLKPHLSLYDMKDFYITGIHMAIRYDLEDATVALAQEGLDLDSRDGYGTTPLMFAVLIDRKYLTEKLVGYNSPVDARIGDKSSTPWAGFTALHFAAKYGRAEIAEMLLTNGAAINSEDVAGKTPLRHAVREGKLDVVRVLLNAKAEKTTPGQRPLIASAKFDQTPERSMEMVQLLLEAGADVNERVHPSLETALYSAAEYLDLESVRVLLQAGADPNITADRGISPLQAACKRGEKGGLPIAKLLLDHGANPNIPNDEGDTPYQLVVRWKKDEYAQCLLQYGATLEPGLLQRPDSAMGPNN